MVDLLADTWQSRDLPFLVEAVRAADERPGRAVLTEDLGRAAGLSEEEARRAAAALLLGRLVVSIGDRELSAVGAPPDYVAGVSAEARRLTGAWPSEDVAADRLVAALDALIERSTGEQRSRLQKVRDGLASAGRDVAVSLAAAVLSGQVG